MELQQIVERFALISSLGLETATKFTYICNDAKNEITSKLLPDVDISLHSERLVAAAAALSLYKYVLYKSVNHTAESFSAGDITVKENASQAVKVSYEIWLEEKAKIADLLQDNDFLFWRVK